MTVFIPLSLIFIIIYLIINPWASITGKILTTIFVLNLAYKNSEIIKNFFESISQNGFINSFDYIYSLLFIAYMIIIYFLLVKYIIEILVTWIKNLEKAKNNYFYFFISLSTTILTNGYYYIVSKSSIFNSQLEGFIFVVYIAMFIVIEIVNGIKKILNKID